MDAKRKWRNLRDIFIRELRKYPKARAGNSGEYNGKWKYFSSMLFLRYEVILRSVNDSASETNESMRTKNCNLLETCDSNLDPKFDDPLDVDELLKKESDTESVCRLNRKRNHSKQSDADHHEEEEEEQEEEETTSMISDSEALYVPKKKKERPKEFEKLEFTSKNIKQEEAREEESSLFLRSLNSYFKNFTPLQQVRVQGKILEVIMHEMENAHEKHQF